MHELGHCVYDIGLDINLPFLEQEPSSSAMTEAVAMMMGDLPKTENILSRLVPQDVLDKFKAELKKMMQDLLIVLFKLLNLKEKCTKIQKEI